MAVAVSTPPARPLMAAVQPRDLATHLWARWQQMLQQRLMYDSEWQDQIELILPGAPDITHQRTPGSQRTERLFDTTAITAAQTLAANMMGAVTNPALVWARYKFRQVELNDDQEVAQWLNACDEIQMAAYAASNFYQACHTFYLNLGVFGTAAMWTGTQYAVKRDLRLEAALRFQTLGTGTYGIAENADGKVDTLFRVLKLSPRQAMQLFEGQCSELIQRAATLPMVMDGPKDFLHCVYPRTDVWRGSRQDNKAMPWASVYLECDTRFVNDESGFEEFPFLVSRWETLGTAPWGFGPGHMALPDIRTINLLKELQLQQLMLWVQPPLKAMAEGVVGSISLAPLAVNYLTQMDNLQPLDLTGRPDLVQLHQQEIQKAIRDMFYADALNALPPVDATQMTAFEVAHRIELMQRLMGPAFTRLLAEMLDPLADRVFGLLWRAGALPPVPRAVLLAAQQTGGQLDVEYEGPLARAQRGPEVKAISETLAVAAQVALQTQSLAVYDNLDTDAMLKEVAKANGTPRHLIRDTAYVTQVRTQRQQAQAQQQQAAQAEQQATTLSKMTPALQALQPQQSGRAA